MRLFTRVNKASPTIHLVFSSEINPTQTTLFIQDDIKMFTLYKNKHTEDVNASTSFSTEHLDVNAAEEYMTFSLHFSSQYLIIAFYLW